MSFSIIIHGHMVDPTIELPCLAGCRPSRSIDVSTIELPSFEQPRLTTAATLAITLNILLEKISDDIVEVADLHQLYKVFERC